MTDEELDQKLLEREGMTQARDEAEEARKALDEEVKPELAVRDGRYDGAVHSATLVDRDTVTYSHDGIKKGLLMAGVGMDVILKVYEENKRVTHSTSVLAKRRG